MNNTYIRQIKVVFYAKKGSKNTRSRGINEFLRAELEVEQAEAADVFGLGERLLKNLVKNTRELRSRSVLDPSPLQLARV